MKSQLRLGKDRNANKASSPLKEADFCLEPRKMADRLAVPKVQGGILKRSNHRLRQNPQNRSFPPNLDLP